MLYPGRRLLLIACEQLSPRINHNKCSCVFPAQEHLLSISSRPAHIRVEYQLNDGLMNLMRVLCTQRKINEYLFEDREEKSRLHIMKDADAHIMYFGHTHKPCHRIPEEQTENGVRYRHAITIGSVGKPKNGSTKGCYVMLTINE